MGQPKGFFMFYFSEAPKENSVIKISGQKYVLLNSEPYTRKDGKLSRLLTWQSNCRICNVQFEVKTGLTGKDLTKKCENCRKNKVVYCGDYSIKNENIVWKPHLTDAELFLQALKFYNDIKKINTKKISYSFLFAYLTFKHEKTNSQAKYMLRKDKKVNFINKLLEVEFIKKEIINNKCFYTLL